MRGPPPRVRSLVSLAAASLCFAAPASANLIRYQCGALASVEVLDGGAGDADAAADAIEHSFSCDVVTDDFAWHAEGTLVGIFAAPDQATTAITELLIINTAGNVGGQSFDFEHVFQSPLGPPAPLHSASLSGHFDNAGGTLNGGLLSYTASVSNLSSETEVILTGIFPADGIPAVGAVPIPFADAGGGVSLLTPIRHRLSLTFYLDSPGDSIVIGEGEGFGAEAAPIPEPATGLLLASALAGIAWHARLRERARRAASLTRAGTP